MTSFVSAMDNFTPKQIGQNCNVEYSWSHDTKELFTQFYFQLVRTKNNKDLVRNLHTLISSFSARDSSGKIKHFKELSLLFALIGHTRDIVEGKGEYDLAFMQILVWYAYFPRLAMKAIDSFVLPRNDGKQPYGSWKDIKNFCKYLKTENNLSINQMEQHPLIKHVIQLFIDQLEEDLNSRVKGEPVSLLAKWFPREKSQFKWLFNIIVKNMPTYLTYVSTAQTPKQKHDAFIKAKIELRKTLSALNKHIDTVQINMCAHQWKDINFNHVTSKSMKIYNKAFLNVKKNGSVKYPESIDRQQCATQFKDHIDKAINKDSSVKVHGKRLNVYELVKEALHNSTGITKDVINLQWEENVKNNSKNIGNVIAMVDTSASMESYNCIPLYSAIGLGIRVSECANEAFKNRVLTFSAEPTWVNLEPFTNFVDKVKHVRRANWGMNTNFYSALKLILDVIVQNNMPPTDVENMVLAVFSDMQIDVASRENMNTMFQQITRMYADAGMLSQWKQPYTPPHILFWNLTKTTGFPCLSSQNNITMLSGYSSVLLNEFTDKGVDVLKEYTPIKMINDILKKTRYDLMRDLITDDLLFS